VFKKLPKTGSSNQPWLTANAKLGTSFFGTLKNPTNFKFQIVLALEHVSTPLKTFEKNHIFSGRQTEDGRTDEHPVWTVRTDVKGASRNKLPPAGPLTLSTSVFLGFGNISTTKKYEISLREIYQKKISKLIND